MNGAQLVLATYFVATVTFFVAHAWFRGGWRAAALVLLFFVVTVGGLLALVTVFPPTGPLQ